MAVLLRNATIVPGGGDWSATHGIDVLILKDRIAALGGNLATPPDIEIVDAQPLIITPAFHNAHTHSPEMLGRGRLPMAGLAEWLTEAYGEGRDALSDADITRAIHLCAADCIRGGAVSVTDHFRQIPQRAHAARVAARAWAETGLHARLAVTVRDRVAPGGGLVAVPNSTGIAQTTADMIALLTGLLDEPSPTTIGLGPSAPQRVTDDLLVALHSLMRERGSFMHMHLCETASDAADCKSLYGMSAIEHLDKLGVLGPGLELPHCVHVSDDDLARVAARGARIVHNPVANLRLGSGVAPIRRALDLGVDVRLGSDGAGSNDSQSLLEATKLAVLSPRAARPPGDWLSPEQALHIATGGARLEAGAIADFIAFDARATAFVGARRDWASLLALAVRETDIVHVVGGGRFLLRDRALRLP